VVPGISYYRDHCKNYVLHKPGSIENVVAGNQYWAYGRTCLRRAVTTRLPPANQFRLPALPNLLNSSSSVVIIIAFFFFLLAGKAGLAQSTGNQISDV